MKRGTAILLAAILVALASFILVRNKAEEPTILYYECDPTLQQLAFYLKDEEGKNYGNFERLRTELREEGRDLVFAMNGGMYKKDGSPQGLYIENGRMLSPTDTLTEGYGNFYLQPNGIFYLMKDKSPHISTTTAFEYNEDIAYATQSGPMLVIDGKIHPKFIKGSANIHIRNGVGILPDGRLLFAMSQEKISFYNFARFFMERGCKNALYLDGFVSRAYLPAKDWEQMDGNFGVIIGETRLK